MSRGTVHRALAELKRRGAVSAARHVRAVDGGRRKLTEQDPRLLGRLNALLEATTPLVAKLVQLLPGQDGDAGSERAERERVE